MRTPNRHRPPTGHRQWGATISEYLPLIMLVAGLLIAGFNHFGDTVRNRTADAAAALAGSPNGTLCERRRWPQCGAGWQR